MFITLTDNEGCHIRINVAHITSYLADTEYKDTTLVAITGGVVRDVVETPEEIDTILTENYITVRSIRNVI